jgi:hypothetical protein
MSTEFIYKPKQNKKNPEKTTIGVKFSKNIYIHPKQLEKWGVTYEENDLIDTPLGKYALLKREDDGNT